MGATVAPCGLNMSQKIGDKRQSISSDIREFNKLYTSINQQFTDNLVASPIFTEIIDDKLSNSSNRDLYTCCRINRVADPVNISAPQFVDLGLSNINTLGKYTSIWTLATIFERPTDVAHGSVPDHIFEITTAVRDNVSAKSDYKYKTDFEIWRENQ